MRPRRFLRSDTLKRALDLAGAAFALQVGAVPMLAIAAAIRLTIGNPVLFRQVRPGLHGKPFTILKFRTMRDAHDAAGRALPDSERLTAFGAWLRAASLDELPEFWNVLCGDMSLVGPRPLLVEYLERYSWRQARRHEVKPGITGWAQINGRNALDWNDKFELDVAYVDGWDVLFDVEILLRTVAKVLARDGIAADGHATMPVFQGSNAG